MKTHSKPAREPAARRSPSRPVAQATPKTLTKAASNAAPKAAQEVTSKAIRKAVKETVMEAATAARSQAITDVTTEITPQPTGEIAAQPTLPAKRASQAAVLPIVTEIARIVRSHFGGVNPIYTEGSFFVYEGRIWIKYAEEALRSFLFARVYENAVVLSRVAEVISYMKVTFRKEHFPEPIGLRKPPGEPRQFRIALKNATIDPLTGAQVVDSPDYYLRTELDFDFIPDASCPRFEGFLEEIVAPDADREDKIILLLQIMGYLLIPTTHLEAMFWFVGSGANGKSVLLQIMRWLIGEKNHSNVPLTSIGDRFNVIQLVGKLANFDDDVRVGNTVQDEFAKKLASGNPLSAEQKGKPVFEFIPYARIVAAMNELPRTRDNSNGFFRRLKIVRFNRQFADHEKDRHLADKLRAELPGIFNCALGGLQDLLSKQDFVKLKSTEAELTAYRREADPMSLFLDEGVSQNGRTRTAEVYAAYKAFCQRGGHPHLNDARFGMAMKQRGLEMVQSNGKRYYPVTLGVDIAEDTPLVATAEGAKARRRVSVDEAFEEEV